MDYAKLHRDELATFAQNRRLTVCSTAACTPDKPKKQDLVRALHLADRNWHFRLFDLSAELRNLVYRELLVFDCETGKPCYPQILGACKQIYDEASDVMYCESVIPIYVSPTSIRVHNHQVSSHGSGGIDLLEVDWPKLLWKARHLIVLPIPAVHQISHGYTGLVPGRFNCALYSLCCHLSISKHKLETLKIDTTRLSPARDARLWASREVPDPLQLLGAVDQITIMSHAGQTVLKDCRWPRFARLLGGELVRKARYVIDEAMAYEKFRRHVSFDHSGYPRDLSELDERYLHEFSEYDWNYGGPKISGLRAVASIRRALEGLHSCDAGWERFLLSNVKAVCHALDLLRIGDMETNMAAEAMEALERMKQSRRARCAITLDERDRQ